MGQTCAPALAALAACMVDDYEMSIDVSLVLYFVVWI